MMMMKMKMMMMMIYLVLAYCSTVVVVAATAATSREPLIVTDYLDDPALARSKAKIDSEVIGYVVF